MAANQNAYYIAYNANQFISECVAEGEEVLSGVYCGQLNERSANINYKHSFTDSNLISCLSISVKNGYYCIIIRDNEVTYAFWSETEPFDTRVANKDLPAMWERFETLEEVKGSYPYESGTAQCAIRSF